MIELLALLGFNIAKDTHGVLEKIDLDADKLRWLANDQDTAFAKVDARFATATAIPPKIDPMVTVKNIQNVS